LKEKKEKIKEGRHRAFAKSRGRRQRPKQIVKRAKRTSCTELELKLKFENKIKNSSDNKRIPVLKFWVC